LEILARPGAIRTNFSSLCPDERYRPRPPPPLSGVLQQYSDCVLVVTSDMNNNVLLLSHKPDKIEETFRFTIVLHLLGANEYAVQYETTRTKNGGNGDMAMAVSAV
jgi:hypothetical protein